MNNTLVLLRKDGFDQALPLGSRRRVEGALRLRLGGMQPQGSALCSPDGSIEARLMGEDERVVELHLVQKGPVDLLRVARELACGLGARVIDPGTGRDPADGALAAEDADATYVLHFMEPLRRPLGPGLTLLPRIRASWPSLDLHALKLHERGWEAQVVLGEAGDHRFELRLAWSDKRGRRAALLSAIRMAESAGWVPYDPQRDRPLYEDEVG